MIRSNKTDDSLLVFAKLGCGILVLILFMWTPQSGRAFLVYLIVLVVVLAIIALIVSRERRSRYRPS